MRIQVCLVSAQAAANLLPALDPKFKPDKIVLVVTRRMQRQADNLLKVLRENTVQVELFNLGNEQHFRQTEEELTELAVRLDGNEVMLNITGGTKLMSAAAQSVAGVSDWRMFYVDADTDQVIWLGKDEPEPQSLQQQLRLRHYLRSYGFSLPAALQRPHAEFGHQELLRILTTRTGSYQDALGTLNYLTQNAEDRNSLSTTLDESQRDSRSLEALLRDFEDAGVLEVSNNAIRFHSVADRDFVKGGWLELHAMQTVHELSGKLGIRDSAMGLEVVDDATGTKNELDIALMARNRLFVIECKTARIDKPVGSSRNPLPPKANDTLFKLAENCKRIGGSGTRGMLLSYRKLKEPELRLADALNIKVVSGGDISRLPEMLTKWISPNS